MKDALPTDDQVFPLIYSVTSEDRFFRVGGIEGPAVDSHLFRLGTGVDWDEAAFAHAAERIYTLERALNVRHWGRDRAMDEQALSGFDYEENWQSPELDAKHTLDREAFRPVADEYYRHLGWDVASGRPTEERLVALGLGGVHAPMMAGRPRPRNGGWLARQPTGPPRPRPSRPTAGPAASTPPVPAVRGPVTRREG